MYKQWNFEWNNFIICSVRFKTLKYQFSAFILQQFLALSPEYNLIFVYSEMKVKKSDAFKNRSIFIIVQLLQIVAIP